MKIMMKLWFRNIDEELKIEFQSVSGRSMLICISSRRRKNNNIYVNDLILAYSNESIMQEFLKKIGTNF